MMEGVGGGGQVASSPGGGVVVRRRAGLLPVPVGLAVEDEFVGGGLEPVDG